MKFGKDLEESCVPEWREKYLDYKLGKRKLKAVARAFRNTASPRLDRSDPRSHKPFLGPDAVLHKPTGDSWSTSRPDADPPGYDAAPDSPTRPLQIPTTGDSDLVFRDDGSRWTRYGSIVGSPPSLPSSLPSSLNLGEPALDADRDQGFLSQLRTQSAGMRAGPHPDDGTQSNQRRPGSGPLRSATATEAARPLSPARSSIPSRLASEPGQEARPPTLRSSTQPGTSRTLGGSPDRIWRDSPAAGAGEHSLLKTLFGRRGKKALTSDVPLEAWKELETRKLEFFDFLDSQLQKIEEFYLEKEEEAEERLETLRQQLHALRDHRAEEVKMRRSVAAQNRQRRREDGEIEHDGHGYHTRKIPLAKDAVLHPLKSAKQVQFRATPKILERATPPSKSMESSRDYERRPSRNDTPYPSAKRMLQTALQEHYRALDLLKSYVLLNRTAFRKIVKKYDKIGMSKKPVKYYDTLSEKAYFITSTVVDDHIRGVEDLYARYFYGDNHKVAVSKLRKTNRSPVEYTPSAFRNGLMLGLGAVFAVESLIKAQRDENGPTDPAMMMHAGFLLQIYGGYFLLLLLLLIFALDCRLFDMAKVNYVFVFEFNTRHNLDWKQYSELPCAFFLLMGVCMWLNFSHVGGTAMYIYWPVVLIGLTVVTIFLPFKILYHESRRWIIESMARLLTPWRPVVFRDFFLGDMMCSETYSLGNIELFFCLYGNKWEGPLYQCNSSHSRALGFLQCLPGIVRILQCFTRYFSTRKKFPHLANATKYFFTILQYMTLSLFRFYPKSPEAKGFFIACATANALYTSAWDLCIDWSLVVNGPRAKYPFLRERLAYKRVWIYYAAMVIDPILRFNWVLYMLHISNLGGGDPQRSARLGFAVSLSEVVRRGIWVIFRVENEHCTNVGNFRASRNTDLPYELPVKESLSVRSKSHQDYDGAVSATSTSPFTSSADGDKASTTSADIEASAANQPHKSPGLRSLRHFQSQQGITPSLPSPGQTIASRFGTLLQGAHAQDFERKRRDGDGYGAGGSSVHGGHDEDDSDVPNTDDEDDGEGDDEHKSKGMMGIGKGKSKQEQREDRRDHEDVREAKDALRVGRGDGDGRAKRR